MLQRATAAIGILIAAATLLAALRWTHAHPLPLWWDEANYTNQAITDREAVARGGLAGGIKALLFNDPERPPAYRALALPFTVIGSPTLPLLRAVALAGTLLAMAALYLACRSLLAVAIVFSMPAVFTSGAWFGTEYALFLAVALLLAALVPRVSPVLLALAVALGLLAKATFVVIVAPALLAAFLLDRSDRVRLGAASASGAAIACGWWAWHLGDALRFAQLGRTFTRASAASLAAKLDIFVRDAIGPLLLLIVIAIALRPCWRTRAGAIGLAASLPLLLFAFASPVFVPRHFAPALLPLALVIAPLLALLQPPARVVVALLALLQITAFAALPERFLPRVEQIDWRILRTVVTKNDPRIAYLGNWPGLSPPEIRYAWLRDGAAADVKWLWRFEKAPIDWTQVMRNATASDAVLVVAPGASWPIDSRLAVDERVDNAYNAELMARLETSGAFQPPVRLQAGKLHPTALFVFLPRYTPARKEE